MIRSLKLYLRTVGFLGTLRAGWAYLVQSKTLVTVRRREIDHPFQLRVPSSDVPTYKHIFQRREYEFENEIAPTVILDAGAHSGLASIYFANRYPQAKILAVEPEKDNFDLLVKNVAPYPQVIPIRAALWNCNETIDLVDPGLGEWGYMTRTESDDAIAGSLRHQVDGVTVDQLLKRYQLANIDLMKLNVEGAEREIFENCDAWIGQVDAVVVKLHDRMKPGCTTSFFAGARGFDKEWTQAGSVCMSRGSRLSAGASFTGQERMDHSDEGI